ncbi:MAG TPA: cysteine--tRNA ligase [Candidatus Saccharimonadales bacterium]|nr:cysteine--tRNA ligase [Candidatus Saccharimonadales bacterium]
MKLYNTLTAKIDDIAPLNPPRVTVYTCGPTVYDYPHIGNWFTFIRYDLLVRTLKAAGLEPEWVMNITDVGHLVSDADEGEDKLEKGARREGKTAWDVATFYANYFQNGLRRLNITRPAHLPKATDHIPEQIALVEQLEAKGYTYTTGDGIYYDTSKFEGYASFARLDLDALQAGARVEHNPEKRNISDFALWKFSPADHQRDMEWDSPWGKGFPGWHLECSAMCMKYLGETVDIHSGGIDHVPVHHTNEIAQSEAATGKRFASYWVHTNHVTVEGEKISKSLGNSITLEDIEKKGFSLTAFRLHVLESHYRSQSKFSWDALEAAQNRLKRWQEIADRRWQVVQPQHFLESLPTGPEESDKTEAEHPYTKLGTQAVAQFKHALQNDLDTPKALAAVELLFAAIEQNGMASFYLSALTQLLQQMQYVLGIDLFSDDITTAQKAVIGQREAARENKNWAASDSLRDQLQAQGIGLRDTPQGAIWYHL